MVKNVWMRGAKGRYSALVFRDSYYPPKPEDAYSITGKNGAWCISQGKKGILHVVDNLSKAEEWIYANA